MHISHAVKFVAFKNRENSVSVVSIGSRIASRMAESNAFPLKIPSITLSGVTNRDWLTEGRQIALGW
jgi:hypothetical protein